jgi:voltage-gated potassium channel
MSNSNQSTKLNSSPYDLFILSLTGLSFLSLAVLAIPYFDSAAQQIAISLDLILSLLFMLDFLFTLHTAPDKRAYLKWGWLDFMGSLPYLPLLRILRVFRAIRSLRIVRQNNLFEILQAIKKQPERTTLYSVTLFSIILVSLSSYAILQTEKSSPYSNIQTISDALWWALATITTVGYGDRVPTTNGGRIIASVLMLMGIGVFSVLTSYLSSLFINRGHQTLKTDNEYLNQRLTAIEEQLKSLTEQLKESSEQED